MAKTQSLSLNPTKISGTCGRLMCCLNYEQAAYEDALSHLPKPESFVLTPDGPGNVSDVNLLKETVSVRLDSRPDSSACYHNCEVCVLRNGKGSRDGIAIPDKRPARYVAQAEPEELPVVGFVSDMKSDDTISERSEFSRRHRNRGSRRNKENAESAPIVRTEQPAEERPASESAEKPSSRSRRRRRGGHNAPKPETAPQPPKAVSASGGEGKRRPRHRGGRHHGKRESGSNSTEA